MGYIDAKTTITRTTMACRYRYGPKGAIGIRGSNPMSTIILAVLPVSAMG